MRKQRIYLDTSKEFDAVKFMREQRDIITKEITGMSPEEIVEYFEKKVKDEIVRPSA